MKTWLAGVPGGGWAKRERKLNYLWKNRLWSYFFLNDGSKEGMALMAMKRKGNKNKVNLFLDSGAFSAWTQGVEIDIYEYINFIKEHEDIIEVYANLDVISQGNTTADKKQAAEETLENQKIMEKAGLCPLPVFHVAEPLEYLKYYTNQYDYVGLGGMVGRPKDTLIPWIDNCFGEYICDKKGIPKVKIHGFGLASLPLMLRYPWYSVDSTSWIVTGRMGSIYVPRYRAGNWVYDENSWKIAVSTRSPQIRDAGKHYSTLSPKEQEIILHYIHSKGYTLGKSEFRSVPQTHEPATGERWAEKKPKRKGDHRLLEIVEEPGLCNRYQLREEINIMYFQDLEKSLPEWPWPYKPQKIKGLL